MSNAERQKQHAENQEILIKKQKVSIADLEKNNKEQAGMIINN